MTVIRVCDSYYGVVTVSNITDNCITVLERCGQDRMTDNEFLQAEAVQVPGWVLYM